MLAYYLEIYNREVGDTGSLLVHFQNKTSYILRNTWGMKNEEVLGEHFYLSKTSFSVFTIHEHPFLLIIQLAEVIFSQRRVSVS